MRGTAFFGLLAILGTTLSTSYALGRAEGRIVRGNYYASGKAAVAGVTVRYERTNVRITSAGNVRGFVRRIVTDRGRVVSNNRLRLRGSVSGVRIRVKARSFTANTRLRIAGGTVVRGTLQGLTDPGARLSRFFRGKISGAPNSNFTLRSR